MKKSCFDQIWSDVSYAKTHPVQKPAGKLILPGFCGAYGLIMNFVLQTAFRHRIHAGNVPHPVRQPVSARMRFRSEL